MLTFYFIILVLSQINSQILIIIDNEKSGLSLELNLGVKVVACRNGDLVICVRMNTRPLIPPRSIGNKGRTLHRSLFGPKPVDSASRRLPHMGCSRPCSYNREMVLLVTFCIQIPI